MKTTCQICAREIKAGSGIIAHHGYQRPERGSGWQTASCFGARHRPYEISCDAIPPAIEMAQNYLNQTKANLKDFRTKPPETFTIQPDRSWSQGKKIEPTVYIRPEGFDGTIKEPDFIMHRTYQSHFWYRVREMTYTIKNVTREIETLKQRLAAWKAPS